MAQAVIEPMIKQGVQPADRFAIYDASPKTMEEVAAKHGCLVADSIPDLVDGADLVICAVKPQNLTQRFFEELRKGEPNENAIFLSVIAGKTISVFEEGGFHKIVRSMPNTPAQIGQGMTVWSCTPNITTEERKKIRTVLSSCGKSVREVVRTRDMSVTPHLLRCSTLDVRG